MLETGWTEGELAVTSPVTVAKLRHAIYAKVMTPTVRLDIDETLVELNDAAITDPKLSEKRRQARIRSKRDGLTAFRKVQSRIREWLLLDDPEPIPEDEL